MRRSRLLPLVAALVLGACDSGTSLPPDGPPAPPVEPPVIPDGPIDIADRWVAVPPEAVGLDPVALAEAHRQMGEIARARSLLVVRKGRLAHETYYPGANAGTLHDVRSVTKSVVGMLAGIAIEEGHLTLDTPLLDLLYGVAVPDDEAEVTVRHLLTMTGGWEWNETSGNDYGRWISSSDHVRYLLDRPVVSTPGTSFRYNSAAVHVLGVAIEQATGETLPDYADRVLFGPLGIQARTWEGSTGGRVNGGSGLDLEARDLARLGQLMLQDGVSGSERILPEGWVDASWAPAFSWRANANPLLNYSYGQLWWTSDGPPARASLAWGYGGQFLYVAPEWDLVVVATTDWRGVSGEPGAVERAVLDVILNAVVPAIRQD